MSHPVELQSKNVEKPELFPQPENRSSQISKTSDLFQNVRKRTAETAFENSLDISRRSPGIKALSSSSSSRIAEGFQNQKIDISQIIFGKADWEKFGDVGEEPLLHPDIEKLLYSPCPIWPGKRVGDTHILTLIPEKINGKPLTLDLLGEIIRNPKEGGFGFAMGYGCYSDCVKNSYGNWDISKFCEKGEKSGSYWVLMTKYFWPDSVCKESYEDKLTVVKPYYQANILEGSVSILMHHAKTGEMLYQKNYILYQEKKKGMFSQENPFYVFGGLSPYGFILTYASDITDLRHVGVAGCRRLGKPIALETDAVIK